MRTKLVNKMKSRIVKKNFLKSVCMVGSTKAVMQLRKIRPKAVLKR